MQTSVEPVPTAVVADRVIRRYADQTAGDDVSLAIEPGELVVLLGPSGCGKTTLLRIIAGLLAQTSGEIRFGATRVDRLPPNERGAGIVFQNYALFPHLDVAANVGYGLRARGESRERIEARVGEMLELVKLGHLAARLPRELSGGQQQRVALARTLAVSPRVLLLDEPFAALDRNLRLDMQIEIRRLQRTLGITTIMVTHDQEEALGMADRIAVMSQGRVEQFAPPETVYDAPSSLFVARFVGTTNLLRGRLRRIDDRFAVTLQGGVEVPIADPAPCSLPGDVQMAIRPEHLVLGDPAGGLRAQVRLVLPLGPSMICELTLEDGSTLKLSTPRDAHAPRPMVGEAVGVRLVSGASARLFAVTDERA
ncbi:MAG TPA: ABC transporter ATP-binding protein [Burkholderiaceae bacterium]|nr:ABC transporter ATP-binding protein [Burkholderiaceae bacterium]